MKVNIDTESKTVALDDGRTLDFYSKEAFEILSALWLKTSWNQKYSYTFTWFGRPIIQHPEDLVRLQEVIYTLKPDVIVETGIAHGGSLIFYASLFKAIGKGKVIGIDIDIRPHNRKALESHELIDYITLIEGSSVDPAIVSRVGELIKPTDTVMVVLDSDHSYAHVLKELDAYHRFVTPGSYIVATDGVMQWVYDVPRGNPNWRTDNPSQAALDFAKAHPEFTIEEPKWLFNESPLDKTITTWPNAWLKRTAGSARGE